MRRTIVALTAVLSVSAFAQNHVNGYMRRDGTYVQGHYRSSPDASRLNNYSSQGNYNPYSGKTGTVDTYRTPQSFTTPSPSSSGVCYTGPRGGTYTVTPGGSKNYGGC